MSRENKLMVFGIVLFALAVNLTDRQTTANPATPNAAEPTRIAGSEAQAKQMAADIKTLQNLLAKHEKGSDDAKEVEVEIKRKTAEFEEFRKATQKEILKAESAIYHKTYQQVETEVADYAKQQGFDLVLRFNSEPLDDQDPQKLIQGMNRQVVFHRELDITDQIIEMVNERN